MTMDDMGGVGERGTFVLSSLKLTYVDITTGIPEPRSTRYIGLSRGHVMFARHKPPLFSMKSFDYEHDYACISMLTCASDIRTRTNTRIRLSFYINALLQANYSCDTICEPLAICSLIKTSL